MTATNHALTGAAIALSVKSPVLAIPLAFVSHFLLDAIPHYNPPKITKDVFTNHFDAWSKKMQYRSFRFIYWTDMLLLAAILIVVFLLDISTASVWTVFFSCVAAVAPDFVGGILYLLRIKKVDLFTRFHIWFQWMERPWGIYVELIWFILMLLLLVILI